MQYFLRPTKLRWSRKENLREGTETPGVDLLANTIDGARTANSLASWTNKDCMPRTLRDHVGSASALSALKKSLVACLSAIRQLSVAKLSAKWIFSLAKRDFLVANGRMAADFSSPDILQSNLSLRPPDKSDHLKIADTQFQSLEFTDSNVRSAFLKMRPPEKCELRTPKVSPKRRSNLQNATTYVILSEKHFLIV